MTPSYRKHSSWPAWGVYVNGRLTASVRAPTMLEAIKAFGADDLLPTGWLVKLVVPAADE